MRRSTVQQTKIYIKTGESRVGDCKNQGLPGSELFSLFHEEDISLAEAKMSMVDMLVSSSGMLLLHLLLHHNLCTESLLVEFDGLRDLVVFQHQVEKGNAMQDATPRRGFIQDD